MMEPDAQAHSSLPAVLRFNTSKHLVPAQWHHLVLTIAKDIKKNCWVTVYLNGTKIGTSKVIVLADCIGELRMNTYSLMCRTVCHCSFFYLTFLVDEVHSAVSWAVHLNGSH